MFRLGFTELGVCIASKTICASVGVLPVSAPMAIAVAIRTQSAELCLIQYCALWVGSTAGGTVTSRLARPRALNNDWISVARGSCAGFGFGSGDATTLVRVVAGVLLVAVATRVAAAVAEARTAALGWTETLVAAMVRVVAAEILGAEPSVGELSVCLRVRCR